MIQIIIVAVMSAIITGLLLTLATNIFSDATDSLFGTGIALDLGESLTANSNEVGHPASDANDEDTGTFWEASQGP